MTLSEELHRSRCLERPTSNSCARACTVDHTTEKIKQAVSRVRSRRLFLELTTGSARAVDEVERNASLECSELLCGSC